MGIYVLTKVSIQYWWFNGTSWGFHGEIWEYLPSLNQDFLGYSVTIKHILDLRIFANIELVGGLERFLFSISYMGCHPSHWRTHIFQDGFCTTNHWGLSMTNWAKGGSVHLLVVQIAHPLRSIPQRARRSLVTTRAKWDQRPSKAQRWTALGPYNGVLMELNHQEWPLKCLKS